MRTRTPLVVAVAAAAVTLTACSGGRGPAGGGPSEPARAGFTAPVPHAAAPATGCGPRRRAFSRPPLRTRIVVTAPVDCRGIPPEHAQIRTAPVGICEAGSDSTGADYRCFAHDRVYDPCWADGTNPDLVAVICRPSPWDGLVRIVLSRQNGLESFGTPEKLLRRFPWAVTLSDGERCLAVQGAHDSMGTGRHARVIDYACGHGYHHVLLRGLHRGPHLWSYDSAYYKPDVGFARGPRETVAVAYFARPDRFVARAARLDVCSASALGFAGWAFERAHHHPDQFPVMRSFACARGYALIRLHMPRLRRPRPVRAHFTTIALVATQHGWAGFKDVRRPTGLNTGIPVEIFAALQVRLMDSADQTQFEIDL